MDLRNLLSFPAFYQFFQDQLIGQKKLREFIVRDILRPRRRERILDIGCGPADILKLLDGVEYVGFDSNPRYIHYDRRKYGNRGKFFCAPFTEVNSAQLGMFDTVLAFQLLHHIPPKEVPEFLQLVRSVLSPNGRFITLDPCYTQNSSSLERLMFSNDRGKYVSTVEQYQALLSPSFANLKTIVRNDILRFKIHFTVMIGTHCNDETF